MCSRPVPKNAMALREAKTLFADELVFGHLDVFEDDLSLPLVTGHPLMLAPDLELAPFRR